VSLPSFVAVLSTLAVGTLGGGIFAAAGMPMPWMLGPLVICMVASQLSGAIGIPTKFRTVLQPVLGVLLGGSFTPALLGELPKWPWVIVTLLGYVIVASIFGFVYFRRVARYDTTTSFFAAMPGGLSDLTLVGAAMGANVVLLGLVHAIRVLMVVVAVPFLLSLWLPSVGQGTPAQAGIRFGLTLYDICILLTCGFVGHFVGTITRMPAGETLGPLLLSGLAHVTGVTDGVTPPVLINIVQVMLGAYVGARFAGLNWRHFRSALLHGSVWSAGLVLLSVAAAYIGSLVSGFGPPQLLLAYAPGGLAEMGLLTLAIGIDVALVTTCHMVRLFVIFLVAPISARYADSRKRPAASMTDTGLNDG
jgi:uncharacterized protein